LSGLPSGTAAQISPMVAEPTALEPVSTRHRIPSLDGLRAISILGVIASHYAAFPVASRVGWFFHSVPGRGVLVFFVISGFLITTLMLGEEAKRQRVNLRAFYVRRAFRILPAAYVYLIVVAFFFRSSVTKANLLMAAAFAGNLSRSPQWIVGHFWTLANEEQFYLFWPVIFVLLARYRRTVLIVALFLVPLMNLLIIRFSWPYWGRVLYSMGDGLAVGCLLALLWVSPWKARIAVLVRPAYFWLILIPTLAVFWVDDWRLPLMGSLAKTLLFRPFMNIAVALIVAKVVLQPPKILNWPPLEYVGRLSYSLYLWQQLFVHQPDASLWVRLLLVVGCAVASYHLVELPMLRVRSRQKRTA
jgi:peptidoglycan/LPS O-acetylase OafA/YrhL